MGKNRIVYGGIALVAVLGLGAAAVGLRRIPSIDAQITNSADLTVRIISPPSDSRYPADAAIPLVVVAQGGHNIAALEYWIDGKMVQSKPPGEGNSPVYVVQTWRWMPQVEGEHLITVRAREASGTVATSNVLRILADKAAGYWILYTTRQGDTWDTVAKMCTTTLAVIGAHNPKLDSTKALPVAIEMWIPCDPMFPSVAAAEGSTPPLADSGPATHMFAPPDNLGVWIDQGLTGGEPPPAAPNLAAGVSGCAVRLQVQDNSSSEQGFTIYRSGGTDFEKIARLGANNGASFTYDDTASVSGKLQYYVGSFRGAQESQSNIVAVDVADTACGASSLNPDAKYADGILSMTEGVDLAYFYASLNGGEWTRLPAGDEFFTPADRKLDLSGHLDTLLKANPQARFADLHLWGWAGGKIKDLGALRITFDKSRLEYCGAAPEPCVGDVTGRMWTTQDAVVGSNQPINAQALTFQFSASAPGATQVLEQISGEPFSESFQPNPAHLIHAELITGHNSGGTIGGQFTIQFSNPGASQAYPFAHLFQPPPTSPFAEWVTSQSNQNAGGPYQDSANSAEHVYYVRIIPWDGNNAVGKVSNTIAITYKPVEQPQAPAMVDQPALFNIKIVAFTGEQHIIYENFGCVTLMELDEAAYRGWLQATYGPNGLIDWSSIIEAHVQQARDAFAAHLVICPEPYTQEESSFWGDLWEAVSSTWNSIVDLYNEMKGGIVYVLANVVNAFTGSCGDTCQSRLMTGLNLAITYFTGIPPNLPTTEQLVEQGLNYAIDAAIQEAGVPCDDACRALMKDGLKATKEALLSGNSQPGCFPGSGGSHGKKPMCLPDGWKVQPIAGAGNSPAVVQVQVTRTNNMPLIGPTQPQYDYALRVSSANDISGLVGQEYACVTGFGYYPDGSSGESHKNFLVSEAVQYALYDPVSLPLWANLKPGSQLDLPVVLKPPKNEDFVYQPFKAAGAPAACSVRVLTAPGYSITVKAELICTNTKTKQPATCPSGSGVTTQDTQTYTP
jgi:hypothetical protein